MLVSVFEAVQLTDQVLLLFSFFMILDFHLGNEAKINMLIVISYVSKFAR